MSGRESIHSSSPSERASAAAWLVQHPDAIQTRELVRALQEETVPRVRRLLIEVLEARQQRSLRSANPSAEPVASAGSGGSQRREAPDIAALIRHELLPAVGWIRLAADEEIPNFSASNTNEAVKRLQRRIDGLTAVIRSESVTLSVLTIPDAILDCWPDPSNAPTIEPQLGSASIDITTDDGLFALLFSNILQNAIDASEDAAGRPEVTMTWGNTDQSYWVRVTNPFRGDRFTLDEVVDLGRSSKTAHQGHGLALVRRIAERLDLSISLEGVNGIASFVVTGRIND